MRPHSSVDAIEASSTPVVDQEAKSLVLPMEIFDADNAHLSFEAVSNDANCLAVPHLRICFVTLLGRDTFSAFDFLDSPTFTGQPF